MEPVTRWEWMRELGMQAGGKPLELGDSLWFLLGGTLVVIGLLSALLHFYRRFPEPGAMVRFVLSSALGLDILIEGFQSAHWLSFSGLPGGLLYLTVGFYLALLIVELARRHWEDLKILMLLPLLPFVVVGIPFAPHLAAGILFVWWLWSVWRRFYLFRSGYRLARGIRPQPVFSPQTLATASEDAEQGRRNPHRDREGATRTEQGNRLLAPVEPEEVYDHEHAKA